MIFFYKKRKKDMKSIMDNQVSLDCFNPVKVHPKILLTIYIKSYYIYFRKISKDFIAKRHVSHDLKGYVFKMIP